MTEEDKLLLNTFEVKFKHLLFLYRKLRQENASLRRLLSEKDAEMSDVKDSLENLEERYRNLKNARILSVNDGELRDTKQRLAKLVREVDKCIKLLGE